MITINVRQPDAESWPSVGHHLRVMSFEDSSADRGISRDLAVDVGSNDIDVPHGHQILRLFHTEGTWEEKQIPPSQPNATVDFTLPEPRYRFTRPESARMADGLDAEAAWRLFTSRPDRDRLPTAMEQFRRPNAAGIHVAIAEGADVTTAFMVPWTTPEAEIDIRVYPGDPDKRIAPRIRMRWDHPELGMILPHLAMGQIGSAAPHTDRLVASGAIDRLVTQGDACGALAIAHVMAERSHELGAPVSLLHRLAEAFPRLPDPLILLAYQAIFAGERDRAVDLTLRAIDVGPPVFTITVRTLQALGFHLEDVKEIAVAHRLSAMVDPGCLFTSARLS